MFGKTFVCLMLALMIGLVVTVPAFAQDTTNTCHPVNPYHSRFPNECLSDFDWKVGWCRAMVLQNGYRFYDISDISLFPHAEEVGWVAANFKWSYKIPEEFNEALCPVLFRPDWTKEEKPWIYAPGNSKHYVDYYRDGHRVRSKTREWYYFVNRRTLKLGPNVGPDYGHNPGP